MNVEIIKGNYRKNYKSLKLRVAAYVRVSTELEAQISSFESQRKYYYSKIYRNSNWKLVKIYEDYGISARSVKNRVGFNSMIRDALEGKIDLILTKSISRFARNTVDSVEYVRLLKEHNVGVLFEEENIYTLDMQSELLLTILSSVAQQESNNYSNRMKLAIKMHFSNGKTRKQLVEYGYYFRNKKIRIKKDQAEIIRRIFNLYIDGKGVPIICDVLNSEQVKPPYNKKWVPNYIYKILRCEKYIGIFKFGNTYQYEDLRIISDEIFNKTKEIMKNNKNYLKEDSNIFSGIVRCGFCGRLQGYCSNIKMYTTATCKQCGCKSGFCISKTNVDKVLLDFQNVLLENYEEVFKCKSNIDNKNKQRIKRIEKSYYNEALLNLDHKLHDRVNKYEFINTNELLNNKLETKLGNLDLKDNQFLKYNEVVNELKERLLDIDSFPIDKASDELVQKLIKYIQFGETMKHHYKSRFNCRIVLKIDENYSPYAYRFKADYPAMCKNESYIVLWKFNTFVWYRQLKKYIKVKIVIDKKDIEVL